MRIAENVKRPKITPLTNSVGLPNRRNRTVNATATVKARMDIISKTPAPVYPAGQLLPHLNNPCPFQPGAATPIIVRRIARPPRIAEANNIIAFCSIPTVIFSLKPIENVSMNSSIYTIHVF